MNAAKGIRLKSWLQFPAMKELGPMTQIRTFRMTALVEGSSFLVLLFVAMPMKYMMGMPIAVRVVGTIHGILFLLYVGQLAKLGTQHQWDNRFSFCAFLASLLPFGPFVFDKYLRAKEVATN
jgi:integral membrane protein